MTFDVVGLKQLDAALGELTKAAARGVAQRSLKAGAAPIRDRAVELAPKREEKLARSIHVTTKKPKGHASKAAFAAAMKAGASRAQAGKAQRAYNRQNPGHFAEVFVATGQLRQAWPQEIGTENMAPQPYMRPALEEKGEEAINIIAGVIEPEIKKGAERAARKALRKASRG